MTVEPPEPDNEVRQEIENLAAEMEGWEEHFNAAVQSSIGSEPCGNELLLPHSRIPAGQFGDQHHERPEGPSA